jgi:molybdopterin-guanine dinucleotide biosynthesis protein A
MTPADAGLAVVILAGGAGRRIGGNKPERLLGDRTLLSQALDRARSWTNEIALAGPGEAPAGIPSLPDPLSIEGPLAGIASALAFARKRGLDMVLTIPCDCPFLPDDLPRRLREALSDGDDVAVAQSGDRIHPTCALWLSRLSPALDDYAASGGRSLHGLIEQRPHVRVRWPFDTVDPFFNVNTAEDLAQAEQWLDSR